MHETDEAKVSSGWQPGVICVMHHATQDAANEQSESIANTVHSRVWLVAYECSYIKCFYTEPPMRSELVPTALAAWAGDVWCFAMSPCCCQ